MDKIKKQIRFEQVFAWGYLIMAIAGFVLTPIIYLSVDNGYIRYGVILPIYFSYQSYKSFKEVSELRRQLNANTDTGDTPHH